MKYPNVLDFVKINYYFLCLISKFAISAFTLTYFTIFPLILGGLAKFGLLNGEGVDKLK